MKERPIIFSGPMVRAILDGRKTQTRRAVKPQPIENRPKTHLLFVGGLKCPYGVPGERLWVKETFLLDWAGFERGPLPKVAPDWDWPACTYYRADGECCDQIPECACAEYDGKTPWRPSIFMPRWVSRLTLEIADVRVQRLQEISEEDAEAEGPQPIYPERMYPDEPLSEYHYVRGFQKLWESINAERGFGWNTNPWVWAITFRRLA